MIDTLFAEKHIAFIVNNSPDCSLCFESRQAQRHRSWWVWGFASCNATQGHQEDFFLEGFVTEIYTRRAREPNAWLVIGRQNVFDVRRVNVIGRN